MRPGGLTHAPLATLLAVWTAGVAAQTCQAAGAASAVAAHQQARGAHRSSRAAPSDAEEVQDKRERRAARRRQNRELKDRVCLNAFGWQWGQEPGQPRQAAVRRGASAGRAEEPDAGYGLFEAVCGKPRSPAERRRFRQLWREWEHASAGSSGPGASSSSRREWSHAGSSGGSAGYAGSGSGYSASGASSGGASSSSSGSSSSSSSSNGSSSSSGYSAGASAGPRWGKASWSWEDFMSAGSNGSSAAGDYEAWYSPPPGSGSRWQAGGSGAWGWHAAWQRAGARRQHDGWQHGGHTPPGGGGGSSATQRYMRLLGLEPSWLASRCGKALRRAYLQRAKAEHPDVHAGGGEGAAAQAKERFLHVQAAYQALLAMAAPG